MSILGIESFSPAEAEKAKQLFKKYDSNKDGLISQEEFEQMVKEWNQRPEPYQVHTLFSRPEIQGNLNESQFLTFYWAFAANFVELAYMKFDMMNIEREIRNSAPPYAAPAETRDSLIRFSMEDETIALDREIKLRLIANKEMLSKQHANFCNMFQRQVSDVFLSIQFPVSSNSQQISAKLKEFIDNLLEMAKQLAAQMIPVLSLFKISTTYTATSVAIIVECSFPLVNEMSKALQSFFDALSQQFVLYISLALKMEKVSSLIETHPTNLGFGFEAQARFDTITQNKLRQLFKKNVESINNLDSDQLFYMLAFLFESIHLEAKFKKSAELLQMLNLPANLSAKNAATELKKAVDVKGLMENFLPGSYNLVQMIKTYGSANFEIGLYSKAIALVLNAKLEGLSAFVDLIL